MKTAELANAVVRALSGEAGLPYALGKAAALASLPRAPSLSDSRSTTPRLRHTGVMPQVDRTRPDAIAPQKTIEPPAI